MFKKDGNIHALRADYYPVLGQLMEEIDLAGTINGIVQPDNTQANVDAGTYVGLFIQHILGDVNIKMYRMDEFFKDKALPLLVPWKPDISLADINDDRAARVLDALWEANPQQVFGAVANSAIAVHGLPTDTVHADTTSKSFYGAYNGDIDDETVPVVTRGHSKNHRPDLKQLVFGVGTTSDGVPIIGEVANGNESDMTLNGRWVRKLRSIMQEEEEDEFLLYIADSSAVTTNNLRIRKKANIDIVSRLPGRFDIEDGLKKEAAETNEWTHIGKLSDEKGAASYKVWDTNGEIDGRRYRFVVVHSDHKDKRKTKAVERAVKKEFDTNSKLIQKLSKRRFACKEDAYLQIEKYNPSLDYHDIEWAVVERQEAVRRAKRGRPKKGDAPKFRTGYYLSGRLVVREDAVNTALERCGMFVLITTLMDEKKYPAGLILEKYKGQGNVERIFRFIKNPAWIGSFCVKKEERLAALGYVLLMAAVIYTLWERRVRMALAAEDEKPIKGLNRQKTRKPTSYALQTVLSGILVLYVVKNYEIKIWLSETLTDNQRRVVELSGFSADIYCGQWEMKEKSERKVSGGAK